MLKPLLFILTIVTFIAIWLNFDFFDTAPKTVVLQTVDRPKVVVPLPAVQSVAIPSKKEIVLVKNDDNLSNEIEALLKKARLLYQKNLNEKALEVYAQIIQKIGNSTNIQHLKYFAETYFDIGIIHQIYPHTDRDLALEAYDMVIKKFEKSDNEELLKLYLNAKLQQAYLFDRDERIEIYDELIREFEAYENNKFQSELEELLYTQSYALMGKDDDEALRILDSILSNYDKEGNTTLPRSAKTSILNTIELSIITNNDDGEYRELADKYLSEEPDTKPLLEMLDIIKNAQDLEQDDALSKWKEEFTDYRFPAWSFQELKAWMRKIEDKATQDRIKKYITAFENHKYNIDTENTAYPNPYVNVSNDADTDTKTTPTVYETENTDTYNPPEYEEGPLIYYEDPYANDMNETIYDGSTVTYTLPYSRETDLETIYRNDMK